MTPFACFRTITCIALAYGLSMIAGLISPKPAVADETIPAIGWTEFYDYSEVPNFPIITIKFITTKAWGTVIGWCQIEGETTFNVLTGEMVGRFIAKSLEFPGTEISGTYTGKVQQIPGTTITMNTSFVTWTEGSGKGRLKGATGKAEVRTVEDESAGPFGFGAGHQKFHGFFRFDN